MKDSRHTPLHTPSGDDKVRGVAALLAPDILNLLDEAPGSLAEETEEMHPADLADVAGDFFCGRGRWFQRSAPGAASGAATTARRSGACRGDDQHEPAHPCLPGSAAPSAGMAERARVSGRV